jgi:hypothetical protein
MIGSLSRNFARATTSLTRRLRPDAPPAGRLVWGAGIELAWGAGFLIWSN